MFVEAVKIVLQEGEVSKLWRFRNEQGIHRNIYVIQVSEEDQQLLIGALRWTLGGAKDPRIKSALVQFTDSGGDSWIIDRSGELYRFFRNRQLFDGPPEIRLREVFKDHLSTASAASASSVGLTDILREYDLVFDGTHLQATQRNLGKVRKSVLEQQGIARLEELKQILQTMLGGTDAPAKVQLEQLLHQGEAMVRRQLGLQHQARDISSISTHLSHIESGLSQRLEQEIAIIERIRKQTEPLNDPAHSPKVLRERLQELEKELASLHERLDTKNFPMPDPDIDWSMVLQSLTRYMACDRLEKSARKSVQDARSMIKPAYDDYRISVGRFLQIDRDLIRELEQCLSELGDQVRRSEADDSKARDGIASKLNKLLGWQAKEGEVLGAPPLSAAQHLEQSRTTVNLCLQQLGKLYADLERHAEVHDDKLGQLDERYEKVVAEYGKAREHWLTVSRQCNLPADIGIRTLVNYINNYSKISLLNQKRVRTQEELQEFRSQVKMLGVLLQEWRTHTGSQKSVSLDNPNMILSEARGVLQYAAKKSDQLHKVRTIESKQEAFRQLRDRLNLDMGQIAMRWRKLLQHLGLPDRPMPVDDWGKLLAAGTECLALERLLISSVKALKNEQIFSGETLDFPLNIYLWKLGTQGNKGRIALLQQLELADDSGLGLIMTDDSASVEMLQKIGVSLGARPSTKAAASASKVQKAGKTVISEKARAALEVFANKTAARSRDNL